MADKKDKPTNKETAELRKIVALEKQRAQLHKAQEKTAKKIQALIEDEHLSIAEKAKLEEDILQSKIAETAQLKLHQKLEKELQKHHDLSEKHLQRMLTHNKLTNKLGKEFNALQAKMPTGFSKAGTVAGQVGKEILGWGAGLTKAAGLIKDITDAGSKPNTIFGKVAKYFYSDIQTSAKQYLRLQSDIIEGQRTFTTNSAASAMNIGTTLDKGRLSDVLAGVAVQRRAQEQLSALGKQTALDLGLPIDKVRELQNQLQFSTNIDIKTKGANEAIAQTTREFSRLVALGVLPADASIEEFAKESKKFGTGTPKDIIKVSQQYRILAELPKKFALNEKDKNSKVAQYLKQNAIDIAQSSRKITESLASQTSNVGTLAASYVALSAKAVEYGLSAEGAGKLSEGILSGLSNKKTAKVDFKEILAAERLRTENRGNSGQTIEKIIASKDFKGNKELEKLMTDQFKEAFASGDAHQLAYVLKGFEDTSQVQNAKLQEISRLSQNRVDIQGNLLDEMLGPAADAEARAVRGELFKRGQKTGNFLELMANEKAVKEAQTAASPKSKESKDLDTKIKAQESIKDPLQQITNTVMDMFTSMGPEMAVILAGMLTALNTMAGISLANKAKQVLISRGGSAGGGVSETGKALTETEKASEYAAKEAAIKAADEAKLAELEALAPKGPGAVSVAENAAQATAKEAQVLKASSMADKLKAMTYASNKPMAKLFPWLAKAAENPLVKGGGKVLGKLAFPLAIGLEGYNAYQTSQDKTLSTNQKASKIGESAANTAADFALLPFALTRGAMSYGAEWTGNKEFSENLDQIKLGTLSKLMLEFTDALGKGTGSEEYINKLKQDMVLQEAPAVPKVAPAVQGQTSQNTTSTSNKQGQTSAQAAQNAPIGSIMSTAKSTAMLANPDGSRQFDFTLVIPGFDEGVYQANTRIALAKPAGTS